MFKQILGEDVRGDKKLFLELSHTKDGYFWARAIKSTLNRDMKLGVKFGKREFFYDIPASKRGEWKAYPLQFANGAYTVTLYEKLFATKYIPCGWFTFFVHMKNPMKAFLYPNEYVPDVRRIEAEMTEEFEAVSELSEHMDIYREVRSYIRKGFMYDPIEAAKKQKRLPNPERCFIEKKGTCQDLSSMAVCMLRNLGVPSRIVIGRCGKKPHSWVNVRIGDKWVRYDPTLDIRGNMTVGEYETERWY